MSAETKFRTKYQDCLTDLKTLSYDSDNDEYLCQNTTYKSYNFDEIVKARNPKCTPASPDTLIFKGNKVYCVEFKNSFKKRVDSGVIKKKLEDGYKVLSEIFIELGLQLTDYQLIFCVVHKGFNESELEKKETKWREIRYRTEYKRIAQFDLEQYKGKGKYFDDILTNDVDFFRKEFIEKINPTLPC
ncbi:hypothetical protein MS2017_1441 [Bathymodiolus thermophilus thioautotrophic gill symbiont]|uniref:Uncharacterized protein n=1 Tax=Bathymodiolus thermophilus thioautotrophic gill symbiont TaxID=2360 RepID=A0A3G3IN07_9GAMM|nr:hypothetical protein [Bathymodiolus thermophilus thioautotrophic gill symbiont]AYQ57129.1 hypothetical protein MS2017_1441 [Bathymodiolus thermophilus thioautotrophic gill symbiont]